MNGSLPPISRLTRATRSAQAAATFLPVATDPVKATPSTRGVAHDRRAHVARAGDQVDDARRQVVEARGEHQGRERRELRGLADHRVPRRQRRRQLPGEQQQRVVPGDDAADHADRLLHDQRELAGLDRGDHPPGEVAPDLGVVVEAGRGPARPRRSSRPAACRPRASSPQRARRSAPAAVSRPRAASRRAPPPASDAHSRAASRAAAIAASSCSASAVPTEATSPRYRDSQRRGAPITRDLLAVDEHPGLEARPCPDRIDELRRAGSDVGPVRCRRASQSHCEQ